MTDPLVGRFDHPETPNRTHEPDLERWAYNQMPKAGWRELKLYRFDGSDLFQWWGKRGKNSDARDWSPFEDPATEAFIIRPRPQPAPAAEKGWRPIETAPKDSSLILTWCVHVNAEFCEDAVAEGYAGPVIAKWTNHNGGGWTWNGLAGTHTHWQPLPEPPSLSEERG